MYYYTSIKQLCPSSVLLGNHFFLFNQDLKRIKWKLWGAAFNVVFYLWNENQYLSILKTSEYKPFILYM